MNRTVLRSSLFACALLVGCHGAGEATRPIIGITSTYRLLGDDRVPHTVVSLAYARTVAENGGVPVILPTIDDPDALNHYIESLDALVLVGGDDIPPQAYGQQAHETVRVMPPQRYDFERELIARWFVSGKPMLGVCLGMQFTNVVAGGSMIQDIPSQVGKQVNHRGYHGVRIDPDSMLAKILGKTRASVFSNHHQAVDRVGDNLKVIARSVDSVPEAMQRTDGRFGLYVQWHPEVMTDREHCDAIYGALVQAAARDRAVRAGSDR